MSDPAGPRTGHMPRGLLLVFDLDGTLIDSLQDLADSANEMVQSLGGPRLAVADVADMVGDGAAALVQRVLAAASLSADPHDALRRFFEIYDRRLLYHTQPYGGISDALTLASRRHTLAVLTNKPTAPSKKILAGLGLSGFFAQVIGGDGSYPRKPSPDGLRALMAAAPGRVAALIGDSPVDEATAHAAGCYFVHARYGFGSRRYGVASPQTPFVLDRPIGLPAIVERLEHVASGT
jgi:phosphoglycolate phosphatase